MKRTPPERRRRSASARAAAGAVATRPGRFRPGPLPVAAVLLVASRALAWNVLPFAAEDAYITFRYARHFAGGHGLVFNPGEAVMGFTSAPWTLWIALGLFLGVDPVVWTRLSTIALELVALAVLVRWLERRMSPGAAWSFGLGYATWPTFAAFAVSGMESALLLPLVALAAALCERRHALAGLALGAVALLRPEGLVAALPVAALARGRDRAIAVAMVVAAAVALAWVYGSPLPQSLTAKSALYGTPGPWAGRAWWEWLSPVPLDGGPVTGEGALLRPFSLVLVPLAVAGAVMLARRRDALAATTLALVLVWLGYAALGVAYFFWYFAAPLSALALLAACGVPWLTRHRLPTVLAAAWAVGVTALAWKAAQPLYVGRAQNEFFGFAAAGNTLNRHARPGEQVLLEPIGMVGWAAPVVVIDEIGLVSPEVARRRLEGPGWYTDVVRARSPEWLLVRRGVVEHNTAFAGAGAPFRSAAERDSVLARYASVAVVDEPSGANALLLLRRRD